MKKQTRNALLDNSKTTDVKNNSISDRVVLYQYNINQNQQESVNQRGSNSPQK